MLIRFGVSFHRVCAYFEVVFYIILCSYYYCSFAYTVLLYRFVPSAQFRLSKLIIFTRAIHSFQFRVFGHFIYVCIFALFTCNNNENNKKNAIILKYFYIFPFHLKHIQSTVPVQLFFFNISIEMSYQKKAHKTTVREKKIILTVTLSI